MAKFDFYPKDFFTVNNIVAVILGIIGLVWLIHGVWRNWKINKINTWPKTNAVILNAVAEPANSSAGNTYIEPRYIVVTTNNSAKYKPIVVYRYNVGNKDYMSKNVVFSGAGSYNALDIKTLLGQLYSGATVPVYFNPNNNSEAYIYNGTKNYMGIIIGLLLIAIAGYLTYYHNHHHFKFGKKTTATSYSDISSPINLTEMEVRSTRTFYRRDFH